MEWSGMMSSKDEVPLTFCCTLHSLLKIGKMDVEEEGRVARTL